MFAEHYTLLAVWGLESSSWLILWSVLGVLSIVLLILLRTRWSKARPWRKCAVLSLWVHLLLGIAATTVRIVAGAPELGGDEPIRVAVVPATVETETEPEEEITPDWEMPTVPALIAPEPKPLEAPEMEPLAAPELPPLPAETSPPSEVAEAVEETPLPSPSEEPLPELSEVQKVEDQESLATSSEEDATTEVDEDEASPEPTLDEQLVQQESPPPPAPQENQSPETYSDRFAHDRLELVEQRGGSVQTEEAVRNALGWLVQAQAENGRWNASQHGAGEERYVLGENRRRAGLNADTGVTGLALLAFLGAGHTHVRGPYAEVVARGLEYLRRVQRADGSLYGEAQMFARTYCHSMATFAVCEAYALSGDERLESVARSAIRYTLSLQHPTDGGWRYLRGHTGDTSQLGWVLMSLKSAELAGIDIPPVTWTRVDRFLRRVERGSVGGLAAYRPEGPPSRTMTAEAMYCRQLRHQQELTRLAPSIANEATRSILQELPTTKRPNLYFWYYASLALQQNQTQSDSAHGAWDEWNHALTTSLISTQNQDGSWKTDTVWGGYGGRVYTTSLAALCLEVYYRYNSVEAAEAVAGRKDWESVRK